MAAVSYQDAGVWADERGELLPASGVITAGAGLSPPADVLAPGHRPWLPGARVACESGL